MNRIVGSGAVRTTTFGGVAPMRGVHGGFRLLVYLVTLGLGALVAALADEISRANRVTVVRIAILTAASVFLLLRFAPTRIVVGADTVAIRWLGWTQRHRIGDITSFEPAERVRRQQRTKRWSPWSTATHTIQVTRTPVLRMDGGGKERTIEFRSSAAAIRQRDQLVECVHDAQVAWRRTHGKPKAETEPRK